MEHEGTQTAPSGMTSGAATAIADGDVATSASAATQPIAVATAPDAAKIPAAGAPKAPRAFGRRWRPTRKGVLIAGGAALVALIAGGVVAYLSFSAQIGALLAARDFCTAVQHQDYPKDYSFFAPQLRAQIPQDAFITISTKGDELQGKVQDCSASGVDVALGGQSVVVHSTITRAIIGKQKNDIHMALVGGAWKISEAPDPLLLPLTAAYRFCEDAKAQRYGDAYQLLAPALQAQVSRDAFTTISAGSDRLNGKVTACNVTGVEAAADHKAVTVHSSVVREKGAQPGDLHLGLLAPGWRIDRSPDPLLLPLAAAFDFCSALKTQNYPAAYGFFAPDLQAQVPQPAFVGISRGNDALNGTVLDCVVTGVDANADVTAVLVRAAIARTKGNAPDDLHLALLGGAWRIDRSPDPLLLPLVTAWTFCEDLKTKSYLAAYGLLGSGLQSQVSQDAFVTILQGADMLQGAVSACNVTGVAMSADGTSVTVQSTLVRTKLSQPGELHLALAGGRWIIADSPDPLLLPLTTAYYFCNDLKAQDYNAAYNLMSARARSKLGSATALQIAIGLSQILTGRLTGCQVTGVSFSADHQTLTISSTLSFDRPQTFPATVYAVLDPGGVWRVDKLTETIYGVPFSVPAN